jgi:hypothetical protein
VRLKCDEQSPAAEFFERLKCCLNLGRMVPVNEAQTVLEDAVLRLLFDYRLNPQNPNNVPMKLSAIAQAVSADPALVRAALDAMSEDRPPKVEEREPFQGEPMFRITGAGVRFVRNMARRTGPEARSQVGHCRAA